MDKEKLMKEFQKYIKDNDAFSQEKLEDLFTKFMEEQDVSFFSDIDEDDTEDVYDYLILAQQASSKNEALKNVKKALQIDPSSLDAKTMFAQLSANTPESLIDKYEKLMQEEIEHLKDIGLYGEDNIGNFWSLYETRPFMRLYDSYICLLIDLGMMKKAIDECREMLRLCENDNLGERYRLIHLYSYFEDVDSAIELKNKYKKDNSTMFLLPLSVLYYKNGNLRESAKYLKQLKNCNKDTIKFFQMVFNHDLEGFDMDTIDEGYRPNTIDEFMVAFKENGYLFIASPMYFRWALKKLKGMK